MTFAIWLAATAAFAAPFHQLPRTATLYTGIQLSARNDEADNPVFAADANGDGYPEMYAYLYQRINYSTIVEMGALSGPGAPPAPPSWVDQSQSDHLVGAADFDGDGDDDLLTDHAPALDLEITLQPGGPQGWEVGNRRSFFGASGGWVLPDLDADGIPELALLDGIDVVLVPGFAVFLEPDGGSLLNWEVARLVLPTGQHITVKARGPEPHDLDGDGNADFVGHLSPAAGGRNTWFVLPDLPSIFARGATVDLVTEAVTAESTASRLLDWSSEPLLADLDGDGDEELLVVSYVDPSTWMLWTWEGDQLYPGPVDVDVAFGGIQIPVYQRYGDVDVEVVRDRNHDGRDELALMADSVARPLLVSLPVAPAVVPMPAWAGAVITEAPGYEMQDLHAGPDYDLDGRSDVVVLGVQSRGQRRVLAGAL